MSHLTGSGLQSPSAHPAGCPLCTEWRTEAESRSRSAVQTKAVLTVEQPGEHQGALLLLWGAAVDWLPGFRRNKGDILGESVPSVR